MIYWLFTIIWTITAVSWIVTGLISGDDEIVRDALILLAIISLYEKVHNK